jgi:hypothetical protein
VEAENAASSSSSTAPAAEQFIEKETASPAMQPPSTFRDRSSFFLLLDVHHDRDFE